MDTVIFGGGVAGLTLAAALHASGRPCRVYERRPTGAATGMGFILSPQVLTDLAYAGVRLPAASAGVRLRRFRHYRPDGELRQVREMPDHWRAIRRADLVRAIRDRLPPGRVATGTELAKLTLQPGDTVAKDMVAEASLATGERVHADLYVAGDGARSLARQALFPTWPQRPARVMEIVAIVEHPEVSDWVGADFHKFSGDRVAAGLVPVDGRTVVWFIQFDSHRFPPPAIRSSPSGCPPPGTAALARRLVGGWARPVQQLLRATDFDRVHVWRPVDSDLLPRFHSGNLALVGDAAHPLLPFTSQGVATAVAGARDLAEALDRHPTLDAALRAYSAACHRRCAPFIRQGRELSRRFLATNGGTGGGADDVLPIAT